MENIKVIRNYTESLFDNAKKRNKQEDVFQDIKNIVEIISANNELKNTLYSPIISKSNKINLIEALATKLKIDEALLKLFLIMINNAREYLLDHLGDYYKQMLDASKGTKQVKIKSYKILGVKDKEIIDKYLKTELVQNNIEVEFEIDDSLLGGILIQYDNKVIDLSVIGYLKKMNNIAVK